MVARKKRSHTRSRNPTPVRKGPIEMTFTWRDGKGAKTAFQRYPSVELARRAARRFTIALHRIGAQSIRYNIRRRIPFNPV